MLRDEYEVYETKLMLLRTQITYFKTMYVLRSTKISRVYKILIDLRHSHDCL